MRYLLILCAASLSGCSSVRVFPAGVDGNEAFVVVSNVWTTGDALPYATKHCAKFGKVPRATGQEGHTVTFDCVRPD